MGKDLKYAGLFQYDKKLSSVKYINKGAKEVYFFKKAFAGCSSLSEVTLDKGIIRIPERAFSGCSSLEKITIPKTVESIDRNAFAGCKMLTDVNLPVRITFI